MKRCNVKLWHLLGLPHVIGGGSGGRQGRACNTFSVIEATDFRPQVGRQRRKQGVSHRLGPLAPAQSSKPAILGLRVAALDGIVSAPLPEAALGASEGRNGSVRERGTGELACFAGWHCWKVID